MIGPLATVEWAGLHTAFLHTDFFFRTCCCSPRDHGFIFVVCNSQIQNKTKHNKMKANSVHGITKEEKNRWRGNAAAKMSFENAADAPAHIQTKKKSKLYNDGICHKQKHKSTWMIAKNGTTPTFCPHSRDTRRFIVYTLRCRCNFFPQTI